MDRMNLRLKKQPFRPLACLANGHLQSIAGCIWRRRFPAVESRLVQQRICLNNGAVLQMERIDLDPRRPHLLVVHGMAGSSRSSYMLALATKALSLGWNATLLNLYDSSNRKPPHIFHAGSSCELEEIVGRLREQLRGGPWFAVGVSLGGNQLLKLLGERGGNLVGMLAGVAVISPVLNLPLAAKCLESVSNSLYRIYFVQRLKRIISRNPKRWKAAVDLKRLDRVRSVKEFDNLVTAPLSGFDGAHDYYQRSSCAPLLSNIRVPTFLLHARDDPILSCSPLESPAVKSNPCLQVCLTNYGGHVGFIGKSGQDKDCFWAENRVLDFFRFLVE